MFYLCIFKQVQNDLFIYYHYYLFFVGVDKHCNTIAVMLAYLYLIIHVNLTDIK